MEEFRRTMMCDPVGESDTRMKLRLLAERYYSESESYDRSVCSGGYYRGSVMPIIKVRP